MARLALRTRASVVAAVVRRLGPWSDCVTGDFEPIEFSPTGDQEDDIHTLTQAIFTALERMVRSCPEQWYIFRPLWLDDIAAESAV